LATLQRRIRALRLEPRVSLLPPVPMTELIAAAAPFDIGLFALPGTSRHNRFALPNKLFEYIAAGLAVVVSNLPEMARIVSEYRLGVTFAAVTPDAIAAALDALDRDTIDACKRASLAAAQSLCWERECRRLVDAYQGALAPTSSIAAVV
jgi:glycosyltransferase involved in cell wall biosynthesis